MPQIQLLKIQQLASALHLLGDQYVLLKHTELRMSKRKSETQMAQILKQIITIKNNHENKTKSQILQQLAKSRQKLQQLKERLKTEKHEQDEIYSSCRKRVHLDQQYITNKKEPTKQDLLREFDKQVLQFMACRNRIKQARVIQKQLKNNEHCELYVQLYERAFNISGSIQKNDLRPLKDWCYEHSHYLTKMKSPLEFKLIACGFINILNNKNGAKAIQFLRKEVATLSLSENDKEQLNGLTYSVLLAQNQSDFEYYSDEEKEKLYQQSLINSKIQQIQQQADKKEKQVVIKQTRRHGIQLELSSSSSSESVEEALVAAQQKMTQIFRAIEDLVNIAKESIGLLGHSDSPLYPHAMEVAEPDVQEEMEEVYQHKFDEMSQQLEEGRKEEIQSPIKIDLGKSIGQKQQIITKQAMKQVKRKHKLDKNNLRILLTQAKQQFLTAFSKIYQLSFNSYFDKTLAIGMSVLKTSSCSQHHDKTGDRHCPTCTHEIQKIIKNIPATLKHESSLLCRINGSLMNEINHPIALPNGQVYSVQGLQKMEKNGKYFCPVEKKWFRKETCRKVFLS